LVKTQGFKDAKYLGDPINAVKIFNEKEADELIVLDIDATVQGDEPDFALIAKLAAECRMPLCYGGGVTTAAQAARIVNLGVEKVAEEAQALLPNARIRIATSNTVTTMALADQLVQEMLRGEVDVLVGTQLVAKGYHFPQLTLIGVLDADMSLHGSDFRAAERTFQLLSQVAGRAGREQQPGRVLIQTVESAHPLLQCLAAWDDAGFYEQELAMRDRASLPPFGRLAALIVSDTVASRAEAAAKQVRAAFDRLGSARGWGTAVAGASTKDLMAGVKILGPVPAPILRLRGQYRYRLLLKSAGDHPLQPLLRQALHNVKLPSTARLKIDLDPYSFY
jgi:primosomal protein N' (replication factor Y)